MNTILEQQWYAVCRASDVGKRPLGLTRFGRALVLWRGPDGAVSCFFDACPHRGAALSRGRTLDGCLACPYHGLRFDADGRCVGMPPHPEGPIPTGMQLRRFPCVLEHGLVWVWNGRERDSLPPRPWDAELDAELQADGGPFLDLEDTFAVNYLRVMENLSDFHHVAHVHRRTAPVPARLDNIEVTRTGTHIRVRGELASEDGKKRFAASTHIVAPSMGVLHFEGLARFAAIATPIDEHNTWLFARYTQTAVRIPGLTTVLTWLFGQFDYRLLQRLEDFPVWRSQRLKSPEDVGQYHWLPADEGVRQFFEAFAELQRAKPAA